MKIKQGLFMTSNSLLWGIIIALLVGSLSDMEIFTVTTGSFSEEFFKLLFVSLMMLYTTTTFRIAIYILALAEIGSAIYVSLFTSLDSNFTWILSLLLYLYVYFIAAYRKPRAIQAVIVAIMALIIAFIKVRLIT